MPKKPAAKRWIAETLFEALGLRMTFAAPRVRHEQRTAHQHLVLFDSPHLGRVLMLDGATQLTSRDEFIYHEMMSHVPILAHGRARNVLITMLLGGLWHGASWNFVVWGGLHGAGLVVCRSWQRLRERYRPGYKSRYSLVGHLATFAFVCFA